MKYLSKCSVLSLLFALILASAVSAQSVISEDDLRFLSYSDMVGQQVILPNTLRSWSNAIYEKNQRGKIRQLDVNDTISTEFLDEKPSMFLAMEEQGKGHYLKFVDSKGSEHFLRVDNKGVSVLDQSFSSSACDKALQLLKTDYNNARADKFLKETKKYSDVFDNVCPVKWSKWSIKDGKVLFSYTAEGNSGELEASQISEKMFYTSSEVAEFTKAHEAKLEAERKAAQETEAKRQQQSKGDKASAKATSSSSSNVKSTTSKSNSTDAKNDSEDDSGFIINLLIIGFVLYYISYKIHKWLNKDKCPKCHKKFALQEINREYFGCSKITREERNGKYYWQYHNKYKVTYECKYCGYRCYKEKTVVDSD